MMMRLARPDEHELVRDLVRTAYAKWVPILGREPLPMTADYQALTAGGHVHVMLDRDAICGVLVLLLEPDHLMLDNICVHPNWQQHGLGDRLLAFVESFARQHHRDEIRLYTNALMTTNIAYYLKHGYLETERRDMGDRIGVFMHKMIDLTQD
jgi:ribosomal protein S18 acetylase RimI-like enzyme